MIVALNNKSNLEKEEFINYLEGLKNIKTNSNLILCPTFLNIPLVNIDIPVGSQNVSINDNGAFTGEISAKQLKSFNVKYAIVGHSERREYQRETNEEIKEKINKLKENDITPILCIGESKEERDNNTYKEVLKEELSILDTNSNVIIAYEPIWSIGTGVIPTNEEIEEVVKFIKDMFPNNKVLYGGSANVDNVDTLKQIELIDGYLLGGLSLKPDKLQIFLDKLN